MDEHHDIYSAYIYQQSFTTHSGCFINPNGKAFENTMRRGEYTGNKHFLLFTQCFLPIQRQKLSLWQGLPLKVPFTTVVALAASVDQDQAA